MRVARCRTQPEMSAQSPEGSSQAGTGRGETAAASPCLAASDALRVLGEALEEIEVLGGGTVATVTNEKALEELLAVSC